MGPTALVDSSMMSPACSTASSRSMQGLCGCPPERTSALFLSLSFTASQMAASRSQRSTISSSFARLRTPCVRNRAKLDEIVERSLRSAAIWDEVKDRLKKSALGLSGGQQQRLCIARALAVEPEVLLMDESTSALDPISTSKIEDLACELKDRYTVVMVTHNMQQAARISDNTAFFLLGELVEFGKTEQVFSTPADKRTEDYITGRFG